MFKQIFFTRVSLVSCFTCTKILNQWMNGFVYELYMKPFELLCVKKFFYTKSILLHTRTITFRIYEHKMMKKFLWSVGVSLKYVFFAKLSNWWMCWFAQNESVMPDIAENMYTYAAQTVLPKLEFMDSRTEWVTDLFKSNTSKNRIMKDYSQKTESVKGYIIRWCIRFLFLKNKKKTKNPILWP